MDNDPTNCDRCNASLERGWSQRYQGDKLIESICFDCDDRERIKEYADTKILTSKIMMRAMFDEMNEEKGKPTKLPIILLHEIIISKQRIDQDIKLWERDVWFNGLQAKVRTSNFRGWRADFEGGCVLVYSMAGRTEFTIETKDESSQITLLTAEDSDESVMGQNSIQATESQALELLRTSRTARLDFRRNDNVNLGF